MRGRNDSRYEQFETSPESTEQELLPAVCEQQKTDRFKENYSIDLMSKMLIIINIYFSRSIKT